MELRPYQQEAEKAVFAEWEKGNKRTLLVLPTGTGKTIVSVKITERCKEWRASSNTAHRAELLNKQRIKLKSNRVKMRSKRQKKVV
ncbi:DEAD/DEAH box helicase family protein [Monoglobus pectinilyticus]|uniref:DEAD/DEAH box helicase family protein n=1 Tax=Monoglobus pectinilyticus TaxID=1981510 RepID=UPI0039999A0C